MSDLYRLCYVSRSRIAPECHADELAAILACAGRHNHLIGISGVLIISGGYFCQVLEGNNTAVEHVFESIQLDDRHDSIRCWNSCRSTRACSAAGTWRPMIAIATIMTPARSGT